MKFAVGMSTAKMMDTIDISKFPRGMNRQLLKLFLSF